MSLWISELYPAQASVASPAIYSAEGMAIAVVVTLALASTVGFVLGYRLSRWRTGVDGASSTSGSDYDAHSLARSRLTHHDGAGKHHLDLYSNHHHPPPSSEKMKDAVSLVLTLPDGTTTTGTGKTEKNLLTLNNGTLPKDYKVKKVYL